jgi:hypothetical protein
VRLSVELDGAKDGLKCVLARSGRRHALTLEQFSMIIPATLAIPLSTVEIRSQELLRLSMPRILLHETVSCIREQVPGMLGECISHSHEIGISVHDRSPGISRFQNGNDSRLC